MKPRKVLVTGGGGFVGTHLRKRLESNGTIVIPNSSDVNSGNVIDVSNMNQLGCFSKEGVDALVHLAGRTSVIDGLKRPYETYYTNLIGTLNVLESSRVANIPKLIFLSTYVYGQPRYLPIDEKHIPNPHSPYNQSKFLAEHLCENYSKDFAINLITIRPFSIYGPGSKPNSLVPSVMRQIRDNGRVILSGKNTKRDLLYIDDFVDLIECMLDNFPPGYNLYNVGFGRSHTLEEVSELLARILRKKMVINYDKNMRQNDIVNMVADISKVSEKFSWKPRTSLDEGLELCVRNLT